MPGVNVSIPLISWTVQTHHLSFLPHSNCSVDDVMQALEDSLTVVATCSTSRYAAGIRCVCTYMILGQQIMLCCLVSLGLQEEGGNGKGLG